METSVLNLFSPFGLWAVSAESAPPLFHFSSLLSLFGRVVPKIFHHPFFVTNGWHTFPAARRTTTTKKEKEEVISVRVSFPSVPLERKWCEYSSLSLLYRTKTRASFEIYFFSSFSHQNREKTRKKKRKKRRRKRRRREEEQIFSRERRHERKKHKKEKKTAHKLCSHSGTCTRKQMKEGTERENGVNAVDACVRFWFSSARDWLFLRWKTRSFFFLSGGKGCFTIQEKRRRRRNFFSCLNRLFLAEWVTRTKRKKNKLDQEEQFFFSFDWIAFDFKLNCRVFYRKIDILRPLKNVRTKNKKASAKLDFSNVLSFVRYDHQ